MVQKIALYILLTQFVQEVCSKLDRNDLNIRYKLGKEATCYENGRYIKDMKYMNRNLKKVVCIDWDPDALKYSEKNSIIIPKFEGDGRDRELVMMIPFLKELAKPEIQDVRVELDKYGHYKPHIKFYKMHPKYHKLLPPEVRFY